MYCKICGASLAPGDVFCKNCGASNSNPNQQPIAPQPPVQPQPVVAPISEPALGPVFNQPEPIQQPSPNTIPYAEPVQPQPIVNQTSMSGTIPSQPTFTQPVQPQTAINNSPKKDNGNLLIIIGVIVGLLAVAVIAYLIYSSLSAKDNSGNNGGGTTVVTQNTYSVYFGDHVFNISSDYIASINGNELNITSSKWQAIIQSYPGTTHSYNLFTEAKFRRSLTASGTITIESISEKTYSGLKYWRIDVYAPSDGSRATYLYAQRTDGGVWAIAVATPTYTKVSDIDIEENLEIIKNAKQSSTSNIETNKEVINVPEIDLSDEQIDGQVTDQTQPTE